MPHLPSFDAFRQAARQYQLVPVYRRLVSDTLTPVTAFHKLDRGQTACLFESVIGGEKVGRYSILAADPFLQLTARGNQVTIRDGEQTRTYEAADPLEELRQQLGQMRAAHWPDLPPFAGGAVGYAGYDVIRYSEHLPNAPLDDRKLPDLSFAFFDQLVVFDNVSKTMFVIALARLTPPARSAAAGTPSAKPDGGRDAGMDGGMDERAVERAYERAYDAARRRVDGLVELLVGNSTNLQCTDIQTSGVPELAYQSNFAREDFEQAIRKCVEYIRAGDIFQVVISQRLEMEVDVDPFEIYRTLRVVNPSPFMFFLRGATDEEDRQLAEDLLADPKERAEHVMLVDLGRNDVGRVARYGSVELSDVMVIERYSHVMHITSNVTGELREGMDAFDALRACLPAGTVSGAPKVRAMQIIDELEPHRRGPYAGAVGYLDFCGNMDTCIALRTIVFQNGRAYVQAGAGIVADSQPALEYQETLNKARGLLKAIEIAQQRAAT
jgi:anthranilate synthase component 1